MREGGNKKYRETQKFNSWVNYFMDEKNRVTHLNATQAAIKAYNYDPARQYDLAAVVGSKNIRKYKYLALGTLDLMGFGFGEFMRIAIQKVLKGSYSDWDKLMVRIGYFEER